MDQRGDQQHDHHGKECFSENKRQKKSFDQFTSQDELQQRVKKLKNHSEKEIRGLQVTTGQKQPPAEDKG